MEEMEQHVHRVVSRLEVHDGFDCLPCREDLSGVIVYLMFFWWA